MSASSVEKLGAINKVSSCFCLAKWLQVTIDLVNGTTHSCHHPKRHKIPISELKENISALHNTNYKKEQRKKMLAGERPSECSYCWEMEDIGNKYSDRYIKSTDFWAWPYLDEIKNLPWDADISPKYLEVMIDSLCNFSCAYCMADVSTGVAAEIKKFGQYPFNSDHRNPSLDSQPGLSPVYLEAFAEWLPKIIHDLKVLRVTGGEPLLSKHFWKIMQDLESSNNSDLEFIINSHFSHKTETILSLSEKINFLLANKKIKSFVLYISLDTHGEQAEYVRHGLDYNTVIKNIEYAFSKIAKLEVVVMCTFNILSIDGFSIFLDDIISLKKKYPVTLDISYLKNPGYLRADLADDELISRAASGLRKMKSFHEFFTSHEISKMENVLNWMQSKKDAKITSRDRSYFFLFIREYDKRKRKNFLQIFPNYKSFLLGSETLYTFTKEKIDYFAKPQK